MCGDDLGEHADLWNELMEEGRDVQQAAMDHPETYDFESDELMEILTDERAQRAA